MVYKLGERRFRVNGELLIANKNRWQFLHYPNLEKYRLRVNSEWLTVTKNRWLCVYVILTLDYPQLFMEL